MVVSTFETSGELGCRVHYVLDRLVLKNDGSMDGVLVSGPVSGTINTGNSYVRWGEMSDAYVSGHPTERGAAWRGMMYNPSEHGSSGPVNLNKDFRLVRETYYDSAIDGTIDYYPDTLSGMYISSGVVASSTISQLNLV